MRIVVEESIQNFGFLMAIVVGVDSMRRWGVVVSVGFCEERDVAVNRAGKRARKMARGVGRAAVKRGRLVASRKRFEGTRQLGMESSEGRGNGEDAEDTADVA